MRKRWIIGILCMALAALAVGCAKKTDQNAAVTAQKTKSESGIAFFMTGRNTYQDADGNTKTNFRFLIENRDPKDIGWTHAIIGKENIKAGDDTIEVYSQYLTDQFRFVSVTLDGDIQPENITYEAGDLQNSEWREAGEDEYKAVGMIKENGSLYLFNGSGNSVGRSGDRAFCTWLAGFTCNTVNEDGTQPQITSADHFAVMDAQGNPLGLVNGAASEPELLANEYGIEVMIEANDSAAVNFAVDHAGLVLRHTSDDGVVTDITLEEPVENDRPVTETTTGTEAKTDTGETAGGNITTDSENNAEQSEDAVSEEDAAEEDTVSEEDAAPADETGHKEA